jgi:hypothetical protein
MLRDESGGNEGLEMDEVQLATDHLAALHRELTELDRERECLVGQIRTSQEAIRAVQGIDQAS